MAHPSRIALYDTTLRDGTQGAGIALSADDKLRIASRLDEFGFDYIEGGWPGSNPKDLEFFERARGVTWRHARLAAFGSTRRPGIPAEEDENLTADRRRAPRRWPPCSASRGTCTSGRRCARPRTRI